MILPVDSGEMAAILEENSGMLETSELEKGANSWEVY